MQYVQQGSVRKDTLVWAGVGAMVIAIVATIVFFAMNSSRVATVTLGDGVFSARIAATHRAQTKGLGGIEVMKPHEAMLFIFDENEVHDIWMKDMKMNIDAVWLNEEKRVVHVEQSLSPASYPKAYGPNKSTRYLIEFPAGTVKEKRITKGKQAIFNEEVL